MDFIGGQLSRESTHGGSREKAMDKKLGYVRRKKLCLIDMSPICPQIRPINSSCISSQKKCKSKRKASNSPSQTPIQTKGNDPLGSPLSSTVSSVNVKRKYRGSSAFLKARKLLQLQANGKDGPVSNETTDMTGVRNIGNDPDCKGDLKNAMKEDSRLRNSSKDQHKGTLDCQESHETISENSVTPSDPFFDISDLDEAISSDSILASLDEVERNYMKSKHSPYDGVSNNKSETVHARSDIIDINGVNEMEIFDNKTFNTINMNSPSFIFRNFSPLPGRNSQTGDQTCGNGTLLGSTFLSIVDLIDDVDQNLHSPILKDKTNNIVKDGKEKNFYGLPLHAKSILSSNRGIEKLYEWQENCLNLEAVNRRQNLIYSLPTSGGKTLVAEILIMRELLCQARDAILILPYVSIVQEKVRSLSPFAVELGFHVEEYAASKGSIPPKKRRKRKSVYIATIEKANALVNSLIDGERVSDLGLVVVDELHMIGDGSGRGATLEICLAKIKYMSETVQIVGMSATLGNIEDLQGFLKAEIFKSDFRPVELKEYVKLEDSLYEVNYDTLRYADSKADQLSFVRKIHHPEFLDKSLWSRDNDHLLSLVTEVIPEHSCLVFCPTKANCQNVALMLARTAPSSLKEKRSEEKSILLKEIKNNVNVICPILKKTIPFGIAYHHSGLTMDERKLIEEGYSLGILCLLCCTSTLAAGVNLPAKRVILRAPYVAGQFLSRSRYKQMVGRAGRAGIDSSGESIVVIQQKDKKKILELVGGPSDQCKSSLLYEDSKGLRSLILTLVGLKICKEVEDVVKFVEGTLFYVQNCNRQDFDLTSDISNAVQCLRNLGLIEVKQKADDPSLYLEATELGRGAFKGCLDVDRTPLIYKELRRGIGKLVLLNDLHLLYLCTPLDNVQDLDINWQIYYRQMSRLKEDELKVAEIIGVPEGFVARKSSGQRCGKNEVDDFVLRRFYITLMLYQLMNEVSVWQTAANFNMPRGFLQNLLNSTTSFASLLTHFTEELKEFWSFKLLIEAMIKKLSYTSSLELVPLMEVPGVKQARAKQLYKAGYHSLASLAWADPEKLMKQIENLPRRQSKLIVSSAKMLLQEKAEALREEAEEMIAGPLNTELKVREDR